MGYFIAFMIGGMCGTVAISIFAAGRIIELENRLATKESELDGEDTI